MIIDFHTHIFPDHIAKNAIPHLAQEGGVQAHLNGTRADLLRSMDDNAIDTSVIGSIATKPNQFQAIFDWSQTLKSDRLTPFASIHPDDSDGIRHLHHIKDAGFKGIKMHPYYQNFFLNEERMLPIFQALADLGLILLMHTGYDIAFPRIRRADPEKILAVHNRFPDLKLVTSHLGAWDQWDEVQALLAGKPIYMDISFSLHLLAQQKAKEIIQAHPAEFILFGSDSPWEDQGALLKRLDDLELERTLLEKIKGENAAHLLGEG